MNKYLKAFLHRGLIFGGFGPIVMGIVYLILSYSIKDFRIDGGQAFTAILSTYMIAFIHAGASVFNQIEHWSPARSLSVHLPALYVTYLAFYLINSWIPFEWAVIAIFTAIFAVGYITIWLTVYLCTRCASKRLNKRLNQ